MNGLGAGARDGAERLDHLVAAHADAVVLDGEAPLVGIDGERDARLGVVAQQRRLGDRLVAQPLAGIGGIRDQLAQKYVFVGIDRMHHQVQQLGDIGLERPALRFVLLDRGHGSIPARQISAGDGVRPMAVQAGVKGSGAAASRGVAPSRKYDLFCQ